MTAPALRETRVYEVDAALRALRDEAREVQPDNSALQTSELVSLGYANLAAEIAECLQEAGFPLDDPMLDWGAGGGFLTFALEALGCKPTYYDFQYDYDAFRLVLDRLKADRVFIGDDPVALPFDDGTFSSVISFGVLEHVPDMPGSLREVMRVLRPGGLLFVHHFPNKFSWTENTAKALGRPCHDVKLTRRALKHLCTDAGFTTLSERYRYLIPRNLANLPRLQSWMTEHAKGVYRFDAFLVKVPILRLLSTTHSLVLQKPAEATEG